MKNEDEAGIQYAELARALEQLGASWITSEVEELIARGKTVQFRELSETEYAGYEDRLHQESLKGLVVGRAKADDSIGISYSSVEQLNLLVSAVERVVLVYEYSIEYISNFTSRLGINNISLEDPVIANGPGSTTPSIRNIPLASPALTGERISILHSVLHNEVLG